MGLSREAMDDRASLLLKAYDEKYVDYAMKFDLTGGRHLILRVKGGKACMWITDNRIMVPDYPYEIFEFEYAELEKAVLNMFVIKQLKGLR